jgi:CelD/BcsL family acetyltransferase involved in cellulose biosynthesis
MYSDNQQDVHEERIGAVVPAGWNPMFSVSSNLYDVEPQWRALEAFGLSSPGQSFDFVRSWVEATNVPKQEQFYVTAYLGKQPLMVLPLAMSKKLGVTILTWFVGDHVACNGPLMNHDLFERLSESQREAFWQSVVAALPVSDVLYLPGLIEGADTEFVAFEGVGKSSVCDHIFRVRFDSWEECDKSRRDRKRRRRDKQHRQKLDALGAVDLVEIAQVGQAEHVLEVMFEQKRKRFEQLGIEDPFTKKEVRDVYSDLFSKSKSVRPLLYALRLNEEVISVRYCVAHQNNLFMLVSSMSVDDDILAGSPGNQCVLEILRQKLGKDSFTMVDIGVGESYEKKRWCNELVPVTSRFLPRTFKGWVFFAAKASLERLKMLVKGNSVLFGYYKAIRGVLPPILRT